MDFYMPVRLFTGRNCLAEHSNELKKLGSRCCLITGASSARKSGALDDAVSVLTVLGTEFTVYDKIAANPLLSSCAEAGEIANAFGAEYILGIGGGSALDAAKAAAVFAANPGLTEDGFYAKAWANAPLPIALIGTTAGTGSEVTKVSVVTDSKSRKHSIHDDLLYASVAFGDAKYTMALPQSVTLSTGIDVLTHCAESYFNRKANDISRAFALKGICKLAAPLAAAAAGEALSYEQREELYEASLFGGLAICVTGTCFPHNVGYYLTENYGIPHGFACAAFFPELLAHAERCAPGYTAAFYAGTGLTKEALLSLTEKALPVFDVRLTEEAITAALPRWENNGSVKATIGEVTLQDIRNMLRKFIQK